MSLDDFIEFAKSEYGITIRPVESDNPDTLETIFGDMLVI